jgi:hypothetical protein
MRYISTARIVARDIKDLNACVEGDVNATPPTLSLYWTPPSRTIIYFETCVSYALRSFFSKIISPSFVVITFPIDKNRYCFLGGYTVLVYTNCCYDAVQRAEQAQVYKEKLLGLRIVHVRLSHNDLYVICSTHWQHTKNEETETEYLKLLIPESALIMILKNTTSMLLFLRT